MEDKEGGAFKGGLITFQMCEWGEKESQRWEIFGAKDGKFYLMLCENADHIISLNTVISPFHSKISPKSKNCFPS